MKKVMALLLTLCLTFQVWTGNAMLVHGASLQEQPAVLEQRTESDADVEKAEADIADAPELSEQVEEPGEAEDTKAEGKTEDIQFQQIEEGQPSEQTEHPGDQEEVNGDEAPPKVTVPEEISVLEVEITSSVLPVQGKVKVQVSAGSEETVQTQELDFTDGMFKTARFNLSPGNYTVRIQAAKFAEYSQSVQMEEGYIKKIRVCTAETALEGKAARGWFRSGDVNLDGVIDKKDVDAVLSAIRNQPDSAECDVNGDGKTDIADLQCVVQSMEEAAKESAIERQKMIPFSDLQATDGTKTEGMEAFLNHQGSLGLVPADSEKEISQDNPVSLAYTLAGDTENNDLIPQMQGMTICAPSQAQQGDEVSSEITDGEVTVVYVDENGQEQTMSVSLAAAAQASAANYRMARAAASVQTEPDGSLVLDFGTQIAVKRVLIKITGTKKTEPLVNIAKVEFVNNMEERIPAPQLDIPEIKDVEPGDKTLSVTWTPQNNVTGYEVYVSGPVKGGETETQTVRVSNAQHMITSILDKDLIYNGKYTIKVRSVNGAWSSPWSQERTGVVKPQSKPDAPDYVKATGGFCSISVSWKDMEDSDGYMVYYKKAKEADTEFRPVVEGFTETPEGTGMIPTNSYVIMSLESGVEYEVYVKGWNEMGWGAASLHHVAAAKGVAPKLPGYRLINTSNGTGKVTNHITAAVYGGHQCFYVFPASNLVYS